VSAALPVAAGEPTLCFPAPLPADRGAAERLLDGVGESDRAVLLLSHGCALPLGDVAWALKLDPSVVAWRLRRLFAAAGAEQAPAVERGVVEVLRERIRSGAASAAQLPAEALQRLAARNGGATAATAARGALGVGSLLLILAGAAGFMVYGAIRDVNPLWRGREQVRQGQYEAARQSFVELGRQGEARAWIAFCFLAEGQFDKALEVLREPEVEQYLPAAFRPHDAPIESLGQDTESPALLPRGLVSVMRPAFVFRPAPAGELSLQLTATALGTDKPRTRVWPIEDTSSRSPVVTFPYPKDMPELPQCTGVWTAPGDTEHPVSFSVVSREQAVKQREDLGRLTQEIPVVAREFLRGQFFLHHELYTQAGDVFARLSRRFPDQVWPRQMVNQIAAALGVDPQAFLR
jgi:hypothetical protein